MNQTKPASQLVSGDRIAFKSGQAPNYSGHNRRLPIEDTIVRIVPYERTRCIVVTVASGLKLSYSWDEAVTLASDDRGESKRLATVTIGATYKGVSLE